MNPKHGTRSFLLFTAILTLTILSCQAGAGLPNPFATQTPTPTNTLLPTSTPTSTPSPTLTPTYTPTSTPLPTGVKTEIQSDGSVLFIDYDNQYQLTLPADWIVVPLSSKDLANNLDGLAAKNPKLADMAKAFKKLDPDVIRVIAINQDSKYMLKGYATNFTLTALEDKVMSVMPLDFVTGAIEESLKRNGAKLLSADNLAAKNPHGVEVGTYEFEQNTPTATGATVRIRAKGIIFQSNGKLIMVHLGTFPQFAQELFPTLDQVTDSIELLQP